MSSTNAFNNTQDTNTVGKQQQQPGYLEQAYNLASNTAATAYNAIAGPTDTTTNYRNQQPHVGGVGDMGTKSDADVTRLPEERANPNPFTSGGTSEALENPNISDPTSIQDRLNARNPPNPYPEGHSNVGATAGDNQFRDQKDRTGGVGDLGTRSDADVVRLPEERSNPNPLSSNTGNTNQFSQPTAGGLTSGSTGFGSTRDDNRDNFGSTGGRTFGDVHDRDTSNFDNDNDRVPRNATGAAAIGATAGTAAMHELSKKDRSNNDTPSTGSHGWRPEQKSWDTGNVTGTMHDPTQHGHSTGVTGSNVDTDHGLGMPHNEGTQRGNRDEGALAGTTGFQEGRRDDFGSRRGDDFNRRDDGLNRRDDDLNRRNDDFTSRDNNDFSRRDDSDLNRRDNDFNRRDDDFNRRDDGLNRRDDDLNRRDDMDTRDDNDTTTSPTGKGPSKLDKLHGKIMVAKGKITKDEEAIAQGQRLQTEGVAVHPSDFINERRE
ncbi:hypothetical protein FRB90_005036 [Tulasnella sp. 427]|nr:hypothetical protein FRB90_005036 [Tulasnella sp. 427]